MTEINNRIRAGKEEITDIGGDFSKSFVNIQQIC
jgi:hypothetical protein